MYTQHGNGDKPTPTPPSFPAAGTIEIRLKGTDADVEWWSQWLLTTVRVETASWTLKNRESDGGVHRFFRAKTPNEETH